MLCSHSDALRQALTIGEQGFSVFNLNGFVRRLSEAVEQQITEFDGFGEPSYKLCRLNKTKALIRRRRLAGESPRVHPKDNANLQLSTVLNTIRSPLA